jgi:hydroxymethylpyrimidine kinase/phosphomethylpyrimidine kinase/thiamine-phosphate diphosphorylase
MKKPVVWSIAGVDPTGLAGIYVDLELFKHFDVEACAITTAVTAQNTMGVAAIEAISADHIASQCEALQQEFMPNAIKIGMLGTVKTQESITPFLTTYKGSVILDPVLKSSSGNSLICSHEKGYIKNLTQLFPYVDVVTPNRMEAEAILNRTLNSYEDIEEAAHAMLALGAKSVLIKGGHVKDSLFSQDYWANGHESFWISNQRLPSKNYRGTGCTLSSAIAACLALGYSVKDAIVIAKMYVTRAIRHAVEITPYTAKLFQGGWPENQMDLPYLSPVPLLKLPSSFKTCQIELYPIVDSSCWVEELLLWGVKYIQLRIKNLKGRALEEEIKRSIFLAKKYKALLFINDYWELALRFGGEGIHLGQEDLKEADRDKIQQAGLYLGVSTHCYYEVALAHTVHPSYMACGPIYPTTSKKMPFNPQGIEQLKRWRRTLSYPLVAIGGINLERLPKILETEVKGIALISAITKAKEPARQTRQFLRLIGEYHD